MESTAVHNYPVFHPLVPYRWVAGGRKVVIHQYSYLAEYTSHQYNLCSKIHLIVQPVFQGYTITTTGRIVGNWVTRKPGTMIPELGEEIQKGKYRNPVVGQ